MVACISISLFHFNFYYFTAIIFHVHWIHLFSTWGKVNKRFASLLSPNRFATVLVTLSANDDSETWKSNRTISMNGNCCARKQIFLYLMRTMESFFFNMKHNSKSRTIFSGNGYGNGNVMKFKFQGCVYVSCQALTQFNYSFFLRYSIWP